MRLRQFWVSFPLLPKLKLFWERITLSRLTTFYFVFSVLHAIIQVALQAQAFSINAQAAAFLWNIVQQGNATTDGFVVLNQDLRLCESPPESLAASSCEVIWDGTPTNDTQYAIASMVSLVPSSSSVQISSPPSPTVFSSSLPSISQSSLPYLGPISSKQTTVTITVSSSAPSSSVLNTKPLPSTFPVPVIVEDDHDEYKKLETRDSLGLIQAIQISGQTHVQIRGLGFEDDDVVLDRSCLWALNWPVSALGNTKREDVVFIAFQLWVLGMSVVALLNESIPHVLASLLTHMLATGWSGFKISRTTSFRDNFTRLTTEGACKPINLLPTYWGPRRDAEIASLAANAAALLVAAFLSWRLTKAFGWRTFKRIGASVAIHRQYTAVLVLSIAIQIGLFFIVAAVILWIDQLYNGAIARLAHNGVVYKIMSTLVLLLLFPWLATGWFSVRQESKTPMLVFIALSSLYLVGWGTMFASVVFRWTFVQWYFFGLMASASVFLTAASLVCGVICRLGFGKGLPRYLNAQLPLPGDDFAIDPSDIEKVNFPSNNVPIPTFSAAFGSGDEVPPPRQMRVAPLQMGPVLHSCSLEPFEPQPFITDTAPPPSVLHPSCPRPFVRSDTGSKMSYCSSDSHLI